MLQFNNTTTEWICCTKDKIWWILFEVKFKFWHWKKCRLKTKTDENKKLSFVILPPHCITSGVSMMPSSETLRKRSRQSADQISDLKCQFVDLETFFILTSWHQIGAMCGTGSKMVIFIIPPLIPKICVFYLKKPILTFSGALASLALSRRVRFSNWLET